VVLIAVENQTPAFPHWLTYQQSIREQVVEVVNSPEGTFDKRSHPTIFHEMFNSDLPPREKDINRLWQEGQVVIGGGTETVGNALTVTTFHLLSNPDIMRRLKEELAEAIPDVTDIPSWQRLEQLPYLVSLSPRLASPQFRDLLTGPPAVRSHIRRPPVSIPFLR
jgi:hypothetical protein